MTSLTEVSVAPPAWRTADVSALWNHTHALVEDVLRSVGREGLLTPRSFRLR